MTIKSESYGPLFDMEHLRRCAGEYDSRPIWFGLGFIQLKLNDVERVHFWCPEIPSPEREEIHDHRYNFTSTVLAGMLHFELYEVTPVPYRHISRADYDSSYSYNNVLESRRLAGVDPTHELFETDCAPGHEGNKEPKVTTVQIAHRGTYDLAAGSQYWFSEKQFHTTQGTEYAITHLRRESKHKQFANVVKVIGAPTTCPFAVQMPEEECWDHIKTALTRAWPYKDRIY
jgi:hypothetical protein